MELHIEDNFARSVAAYKQFDVLLVNAIFDGMNLVAKEAPLVNERDGVLILSENTGAHEELQRWAITSTPSTCPHRPGDPRGARDAGRRAEGADRRDPGARPRARPHRVDRAPALDLDRWSSRTTVRTDRRGERTITPVDPATLEPVGTVEVTPPEAIDEIVSEARLVQRRWADLARRAARVARPCRARPARLRRRARRGHHRRDGEAGAGGVHGRALPRARAAPLDGGQRGAGDRRGARALRRAVPPPQARPAAVRAVRRGRRDRAVELPFRHPVHADDRGSRGGERRRGQAVRARPADRRVGPASLRGSRRPGWARAHVQGDGATGELLVRARGIAKVFFTGSTGVGRKVAAAAGERLCPVSLELGGKDAMLVFEDADLDRAVEGALWGSFSNCGQTCASVERIYVARTSTSPSWKSSAGGRAAADRRRSDFKTELGPLISEQQRTSRATRLRALEGGASATTGGGRPDVGLPGWFYEPTVLTGVAGGRGARARGDLRPGRRSRAVRRRAGGRPARERLPLRPERQRVDA